MFAGMAKLVDALDLGSSERSWGFESLYPHQKRTRIGEFFCCARDSLGYAQQTLMRLNPHGVAGARRCLPVSGVKISLDCESLYPHQTEISFIARFFIVGMDLSI